MTHKYVLDAHTLIWFLEGNPRIGKAAKSVFDDQTSELILPVIALAEAVHVVGKNRTDIKSVADLLRDVLSDARIQIYPLDLAMLRRSLTITNVPEMHDRLIVATALYVQDVGNEVDMLTKDLSIVAAGLVNIVW